MKEVRLALLAESCVIGAGDVLHPCRLQIICGSAMEKQDRPKEDKHSRVARIEQDEKGARRSAQSSWKYRLVL
ncbi:hypothetical protein SNOG_12386 [Parastagonospora nodorum SN15]|uniref:Uncharacterized protein n=1 Tax=Phaeosphaeria nodorum (strain SN15 / ATCC MYA-4574 / FGSC 10173) TaxID=321614 RepID=Q0U778_PHANO|nr:hypothetical protein SNOG_12386 [Parastagonospora nodorum SN15]EAT80199.1 hypothetical protein SNOG_12386 [Parastagonospora nodorum SN15]